MRWSAPGCRPLATTRRRSCATLAAMLCGGLLPRARAQGKSGSVLQFGADPGGQKDSSAAFAEAIRQLQVVNVPAGTYLVGNLTLRAGTTLVGEGERSVLRQKPGKGFIVVCDSGKPDPEANLRGITLRSLQLRGNCDTEGFEEHTHAASLSGVTDATIEGVVFRGFRGDGLYLGSSNQAQGERHNRRVVVRDCLFDGIDRQNRNGISVIDCDDLLIEKCRFVDIARDDMPGAVDLEPNANAFHVIRNVRIVGNTFKGIGGNGATVALFVPKPLTSPPSRIVIEGNTIEGTRNSAFGLVQLFAPQPGSPPQELSVRDNRVRGPVVHPLDLRGVSGVEIRNNRFEGASGAALIGGRTSKEAVRDVHLLENRFRECGSAGGAGVDVASVDRLRFTRNEFVDCGNGQARSAAVEFVEGASQGVSFAGNRFTSPGRKTKWAVATVSHRFAAATNEFASDNSVDTGLRVAFEGKGAPAR